MYTYSGINYQGDTPNDLIIFPLDQIKPLLIFRVLDQTYSPHVENQFQSNMKEFPALDECRHWSQLPLPWVLHSLRFTEQHCLTSWWRLSLILNQYGWSLTKEQSLKADSGVPDSLTGWRTSEKTHIVIIKKLKKILHLVIFFLSSVISNVGSSALSEI